MSAQGIDPFAFGETRGGMGRAGKLAGRAVLFVRLDDEFWELLHTAVPDDGSEDEASVWRSTAEARATFSGWDIDWVPSEATRGFAAQHFQNLDPRVVWGDKGRARVVRQHRIRRVVTLSDAKQRAELERARDEQTLLRVDRSPRFADLLTGFVVRVGTTWVLLAQVADGGYFDGFAAFRLGDVRRVVHDPTFAAAFARTQPAWPPTPPGPVDLDSTEGVLTSLGREGALIGIQKERERRATWIGTLDEIQSRFVYLWEVRPDASWHPEPLGYRLRAITEVETDTRYLRALAASAAPRPGI